MAAAQIEDVVLSQLKTMLRSPEIIVATWRVARRSIEGLTEQAVRDELIRFDELWSELFPAEQARITQLLVARVDVSEDGVDITLRVDGFASILHDIRSETKESARKAPTNGNSATMTVHVPVTFVLRGGRKIIISEVAPAPPQSKIDNALLKALARSHSWRRMIEGHEYASITELAKAEGINQSYACRLLRLTLLSPAIVTEILNGRQNSNLLLKQLSKPFPVEWQQQSRLFNATFTLRDPHMKSRLIKQST